MRHHSLFVIPLVASLAWIALPPTSADETLHTKKIDKLIEQLGSDVFAEREEASKELAAIGVPALEALRQAAKSEDAEVRKRAEELLPRIEMQAESMRILAPTRVHLLYKDISLGEAVAEFQKKSGYQIQLHDPDGKLRARKITLDTGETTFWHALTLFCDKAELTEASIEDRIQAPQLPGLAGAQAVIVRPGRNWAAGGNGPIVLKEGQALKRPTDDRSAARIRALGKSDLFGGVPDGEIILALEVSLEPKLQWQLFQSIHIDKAVDDRGQKLAQVIPQVEGAAGIAGANLAGGVVNFQQRQMQMQFIVQQRRGWGILSLQVPVQLKKGAKEAQSLKELSGVLTVQLLTQPQPLITADQLDKAKLFKGDEGGSIKMVRVESGSKETVLQLEFEQPPYDRVVPAQANVILGNGIQGGAVFVGEKALMRDGFMESFNGLTVQDDKGRSLPIKIVSVTARLQRQPGVGAAIGQIMTYTLICRHEKDKSQPAKVVYLGRKRATVEIPFAFKDVPLQ